MRTTPAVPGRWNLPRRPRLDHPGAIHHVIARGVDRRDLFRDDADRAAYCDRLSLVLPEEGATCLAWALMPNHVHLALRTGPRPLARAMHRVGTRYGRYFNDRHGRAGYLFEGRYKAIPVSDDEYLATLIRYVHRNPLRAGLVASLGELARYRWTGHAALMGRGPAAPFHAWGEALRLFDDRISTARAALRELMDRDERAPQPGSAIAVDDVAPASAEAQPAEIDRATDLVDLIRGVCGVHCVPEEAVRSGSRRRDVSLARAEIGYLALHRLGIPVAETARWLGVSRQSLWERLGDGRRAAQARRDDAEST